MQFKHYTSTLIGNIEGKLTTACMCIWFQFITINTMFQLQTNGVPKMTHIVYCICHFHLLDITFIALLTNEWWIAYVNG